MKRIARIAVVGSSNTDIILRVRRLPRPGETVLGGALSIVAGGKGANQAVAAARAGGQVALVARVGCDSFGRAALAGFRRDRIEARRIARDRAQPSGVALICVAADGQNSIAVAPGANACLSPADIRRARAQLARADWILLQLEIPTETVAAALEAAAAARVPVILNPAPASPLAPVLLRQAAVLTPNETEAELLTGVRIRSESDASRAGRALLDLGVPVVLITMGTRGVWVGTRQMQQQAPAFRVRPVDTTAAGDVFNGALAVALAEGRPLLDAVRFAQAAAAISVTRPGAQPSAPRRREIVRLERTGQIQPAR
ncbi:MAG: ribokinase [Verrucomicrobia bacterium]|nr:ribokinase [Verrucomicrobiota bacterium]